MKVPKDVEKILDKLDRWYAGLDGGSDDFLDPDEAARAIEALILKSNQELLDRVERELPEKYDLNKDKTILEAKVPQSVKTQVTDNEISALAIGGMTAHNEAIDQTKATIDRIRGEL